MPAKKRKAAVPALPSPLWIGHQRIEVVADDSRIRTEDTLGEFQPDQSRIVVAESLRGPRLVEVVLHEMLHAFWRLSALGEADGPGGPGEEIVVSVLAQRMTETAIRNPRLLDWIAATLGEA